MHVRETRIGKITSLNPTFQVFFITYRCIGFFLDMSSYQNKSSFWEFNKKKKHCVLNNWDIQLFLALFSGDALWETGSFYLVRAEQIVLEPRGPNTVLLCFLKTALCPLENNRVQNNINFPVQQLTTFHVHTSSFWTDFFTLYSACSERSCSKKKTPKRQI